MGQCLVCKKDGAEQWFMWDSLTNKEPWYGSVQCKATLFTPEFIKGFERTHIQTQPPVELTPVVERKLPQISRLPELVIALYEKSIGGENDMSKQKVKKEKKVKAGKYSHEGLKKQYEAAGKSVAVLAKQLSKHPSSIRAALVRYNIL